MENQIYSKNCAMLLLKCLVFLLLWHHHPVKSLKINQNGGYEDVVISIGNDVPPIVCQQLLQNINETFTAASNYLNIATNGNLYFHRIVIVIPSSWENSACGLPPASMNFTSVSSIDQAQFILGTEHPIFGHSPFTQQSQGCGKSGDFIGFGYKYFFPNNDTSDSWNEFPERTIVHEWIKYRYGVFEETGFENDPIFPLTYKIGSNINDELKPTFCANVELQGNWSSSCKFLTGENCAFSPLLNNNIKNSSNMTNVESVTSSIMSVPNLPNVKSFCDSSNHNSLAPTKQNFQCQGRSIQDVMNEHSDYHYLPSESTKYSRKTISLEIVVKKLTQPRYVLIIEETASMNLRDVWKYLKLAVRKFIKYDLQFGTQVGLLTINSDVSILANMTTTEPGKSTFSVADRLPNYPYNDSGSLSLLKGISQAINMLKWNGARVAGSVIILISQATISTTDIEASKALLEKQEVSLASIEYPARRGGDGSRVAVLSQATNSPYFSVRETDAGLVSHMSTYIQLVNALSNIQRFFTTPTNLGGKYSTLIHQQEFRGDSSQSFVESAFNFDASQPPAQFHIYVANPIDPKFNKVVLRSPSGRIYTDQLSGLHDINIIKINANIDQPGLWQYSIERLGDSHQSVIVQVVTTGSWSQQQDQLTVRIYSNVHDTRTVNLQQFPLILYADVKKGPSPVLDADVEAFIVSKNTRWTIKLLDSGNGDPDLTKGDGVYSRYILPPKDIRASVLDITVKVTTSPKYSKYLTIDPNLPRKSTNKNQSSCCGSVLVSNESNSLKKMPYNERIASLYSVKVTNSLVTHNYPPSRVGDLKVIDSIDKNVTFQFTAPGDDYDTGILSNYTFSFSDNRDTLSIVKMEKFYTGSPGGTLVSFTTSFDTYNKIYYVWLTAIDLYQRSSLKSNIVQVLVSSPSVYGPNGAGNSDLLAEGGTAEGSKPAGNKFGSFEIALIVVGIAGLVIVAIGISWGCICCRRKASKKEMSSTETNVYTISEVKEPIHWSASELLQEHEKRQSIYAQSHPPRTADNPGQRHHSQRQSQSSHYHNPSPGSSMRSFRSFNDGQWRASLNDGRRPTLTDYESCSSDPILKGGPTDYDTAVDSDRGSEDNYHYRTIDSYVGATYRANHNLAMVASEGSMNDHGQATHVQYNYNANNYQGSLNPGSLTSVNSKRRNITMV